MNTITHLNVDQLGCIRQGKFLFPSVSFSLHAGEILLVEGANGAGKSSLLRLLAGTATPAEGNIFWNEQSVTATLIDYAEQLHYVGHTNGIRLGLTVAENLQLAGELSQYPVNDMDTTLAQLQLSSHKNTQTQFLSAGQKRRTALARLLLIPRTLWILDEPFTSLDAATQQVLLAKIQEHVTHGGMCIMTSHQPVALTIPVQQLRLTP